MNNQGFNYKQLQLSFVMNLGSSTDERAKRSRVVVRLNFGIRLGQVLVTALNQAESSSPKIVPSFSKTKK